MKNLIITVAVVFSMAFGCTEDFENECSTLVTVVDKTGLDGCGLVLQLENGDFLEPIIENELVQQKFENYAINGNQLKIDYTEANDMASICMIGKIVRVSCVSLHNSSQEEAN